MKYAIYKTKRCATNDHLNIGFEYKRENIISHDSINKAYDVLNRHYYNTYRFSKCDCEAEVREID